MRSLLALAALLLPSSDGHDCSARAAPLAAAAPEGRALPNLPLRTLGGLQLWADLRWWREWRRRREARRTRER